MSAITDLVTGLVGGIGDAAIKIRTAITGIDPAKQAELQELVTQLEGQAMKSQTDINAVEAASKNIFVAGWRPGIGWVCVFAFALNYLVYPLLTWGLMIAKVSLSPALPQLDLTTMMPILLGLLGLGTMRTVEKINGAQGNH